MQACLLDLATHPAPFCHSFVAFQDPATQRRFCTVLTGLLFLCKLADMGERDPGRQAVVLLGNCRCLGAGRGRPQRQTGSMRSTNYPPAASDPMIASCF